MFGFDYSGVGGLREGEGFGTMLLKRTKHRNRIPVIGGLAGLLISPLVMFAMPLIVDQKMEFWPAIQASLEKAKADYVSLLVVSLLGSVISGIGLLLCGIGVILTAPFGAILTVVAYRHMFEGVTAEPVPVADAASMDAPPPEPTQA